MSIQLDWDVESDAGHRAVAEDAQIIAAHQRRQRRLRFTLIAAALALIVIAGMAFWRYQTVQKQRYQALLDTVEAETLALRLGDKHKFMQVQGSAEAWRATQRQHFDEIQSLGVSVNVTGTISDLHYTPEEAEAFIEVLIDGARHQAAWLYEYTDNGWKHVATRQTPWYTRTTGFGPFTFTYNSVQEPAADRLKTLLRQWWADAAARTGITSPPTLKVVIDPEAHSVAWSDGGQHKLLIPSQVLAQSALDDPADPLRTQLALLLADQWADHLTPDDSVQTQLERWQHWQLGLVMQSTFGLPRDPHNALDHLTTAFGDQFLRDFVAYWQFNDGQFALRQAAIDNAPNNPDPDYFQSLLEFLVVANAYDPALSYDARRASWVLFDTAEITTVDEFVMSDWVRAAQPNTIRVEQVERFGTVIWVTISFAYNPFWYDPYDPTLQSESYPMSRQIPFRSSSGFWQFTTPTPEDWGTSMAVQGDYATLYYTQLDAAYYETRLPLIEEIYQQAAQDFALSAPPPLFVSANFSSFMFGDKDAGILVPLGSPRTQTLPADTDLDLYIRTNMVVTIYAEVFAYINEGRQPRPGTAEIEYALRRWAYQRHGWLADQEPRWLTTTTVHSDIPMINDWDDLWLGGPAQNNVTDLASASYSWALNQLAAETLIEVLIQFGGEEAFVPMVLNIRTSQTIDEWIAKSLSHEDYDELVFIYIEEYWQGQFWEKVRHYFGDAAFNP